MSMQFQLEKKYWTDADFDIMGWHDCTIYKMRFAEDFEMDIDYIFQWNKPDLEGLPFTFGFHCVGVPDRTSTAAARFLVCPPTVLNIPPK